MCSPRFTHAAAARVRLSEARLRTCYRAPNTVVTVVAGTGEPHNQGVRHAVVLRQRHSQWHGVLSDHHATAAREAVGGNSCPGHRRSTAVCPAGCYVRRANLRVTSAPLPRSPPSEACGSDKGALVACGCPGLANDVGCVCALCMDSAFVSCWKISVDMSFCLPLSPGATGPIYTIDGGHSPRAARCRWVGLGRQQPSPR
jgi:hypothetical protein